MLIKHGSYVLEISGNILLVEATGPWDDIAIREYTQDNKAVVKQMAGNEWGCLAVFTGNAIMPPDAEQDLIATTAWRVKHGLAAVALVVTETFIPALVKSQFTRIYTSAKVKFAFFNSKQSALEWLLQQGFHK